MQYLECKSGVTVFQMHPIMDIEKVSIIIYQFEEFLLQSFVVSGNGSNGGRPLRICCSQGPSTITKRVLSVIEMQQRSILAIICDG